MRSLAPLALAVAMNGCGSAAPASAPSGRASNETGSGGGPAAPDVRSCTPEGSPLRFELVDLPADVLLTSWGRRSCMLGPADAPDDPPWAYAVVLSVRERQPGDVVAPIEERMRRDADAVARGELELLGAPRPWLGFRGEQLLVGEGEVRHVELDLTRHWLEVVVLFAASTPEPMRARVLSALSRLRVVGLERASDARLHDPGLAFCEADGVPLLVPVPEGGAHQASWPSQCMVAPDGDPTTVPWSMWIGSIATSDAGAEQLLGREPDGARAWAEAALSDARFLEEGTVTFLGTPTRWYAFAGAMDASEPERRLTVARVRRGDRHVIAVLASAPDDPPQAERLLEALAGAREP